MCLNFITSVTISLLVIHVCQVIIKYNTRTLVVNTTILPFGGLNTSVNNGCIYMLIICKSQKYQQIFFRVLHLFVYYLIYCII